MKTPVRVSLDEFAAERKKWIEENCVTDGDLQRCKKCNAAMEIVPAFISMHDARFEQCTGGGVALRLAIPFCPKCETKPEDHGCFHEFPLRRNNAQLS